MKIILVAGARPNFMKIAPLIRALDVTPMQPGLSENNISWKLVHTGQHYDYDMSKIFFQELEIPEPDYFLEVGSGTHAEQTAKVMVQFEKVCLEETPDVVLVVGDVNSTLACSITAKKLNIKVAHVEAGLRSGDMAMPEEVNRIVTDSISDYLFVTERNGLENLENEGKLKEKIFFVGHVMIDNLFYQLNRLNSNTFETTPLKEGLGKYLFLTLHRPSNVDDSKVLKRILDALNEIAEKIPIFFPVHPRTKARMEDLGVDLSQNIKVLNPLGFTEALYLWKDAIAVLTDSGGLQEETTSLGVPCITLRENTERPVTVEVGTNTIVGTDTVKLRETVLNIIDGHYKEGQIPEKWDGKAAERIIQILSNI
ncbi:MAG: UDP-N-acetylglucosamine 2-epimerase (non-hydrolyzing) [Candidatus Scalindua sp. AMX11]|nr:MAG: UDP-N-acetylglucosamine 2-epimerase (non-hydrolyzing) [Candidatus Scalindua sp.]NOG82964.1 UDP-N-acetylglucosamine 2-epimerase (non-hydrolyzing) [Planctomycetota bacterium]RZV68736.1 MAG: UDP-N-acetylglucosamine 2-epimerase (non-hydrolyzing) [Candidatus Scalindua sp. SCAELEC01]TDE63844.1 MAG: UDP-N-acetylglucosamine 2-epimerase (non-hydrolyzing) [Candidatus Scalindua sp. AMX11]